MTDLRWLPGPLEEHWDWQARGRCDETTSELFFHPQNERGVARTDREERAKRLCAACPVRRECADHALSSRQVYGVWGGLSPEERGTQVSDS